MTSFALDPGSLADAIAPAFAGGTEPPTPALLDAWRQAHHAAQIASEVGKAWAAPREDDSHSSFAFRVGALHGEPALATPPFHAALSLATLELVIADAADTPLALRALDGATSAEGTAWMRAEAERRAGPARQPARPAPDLPPHPVAQGAAFRFDRAAGAALVRLLDQADTVLRRIAEPLPAAGPLRVWPHHFDLATLVPLAAGPDGVAASLGLGLAVPDAFAASGYWYASPWRAEPPARAPEWPSLPWGRWAPRGDELPLGVLPLDALSGLAPRDAARAVAAFFAAASAAAARLV